MVPPKVSSVIMGSTGMVGKGVLLECLKSDLVEKVLAINRHPLGINHPKLKEVVQENFNDFSAISSELKNYNACFYCIGISAAGLSEEKYSKVNYDMVLTFAKDLYRVNPHLIFVYVSGKGTDSSEKGSVMWARVKGKTENALLKMGFKAAYMFRPGLIQPLGGLKSRTKWYNVFYAIFKPFYFVFKHFKNYVTNTEAMGKAMIAATVFGYRNNIIYSKEINELSEHADL